MRYRLFSKTGDALSLAYRIANEGNECDVWIKNKSARDSYDGILPKVSNYQQGLTKQTICLFDMVKMGALADKLKRLGYKVYGASRMCDALELNRELMFKLADINDIKIPKWKKFKSYDKATKFIKQNQDTVWVFKPLGNQPTTYTHIPSNNEEMLEMLDYFKQKVKGEFILQEKIEGCELSTEGYYTAGKKVSNSINSTIEKKAFTEQDKSVNTGCMSSLVWFWKKKNPKSYRLTLKRLESFLAKFKYSAPLDINCMINKRDGMPYLLEATCRMGYSAVYAQIEALNIEVGKFFYELANGRTPKIKPSYDYTGSLRLTIPPYPFKERGEDGVPILGVPDLGLEHLHLLDVKFKEGKLLSAGVDGVIGEVTGRNKNIKKIEKQIKERIAKLTIPNLHYRSDVFSKSLEDIKFLKKHNYFK